jgi:hypothetical protein
LIIHITGAIHDKKKGENKSLKNCPLNADSALITSDNLVKGNF